MSFSSLGLSAPILHGISLQKYEQPFPIQEQAIPAILKGKDVFGIAQTGSGKTASFVLPILELLLHKKPLPSRHIRVLVLVPTRELAAQVADVFISFNAPLTRNIQIKAVYGGVSINPQMMALAQTEILVATPGRLLDLHSSNAVQLSSVQILVLDEADKMLNLGFQEEMEKILVLLPQKKQCILFSATQGDEVQSMKNSLLHDPLLLEIVPETQPVEQIRQIAYQVVPEKKGVLLRYLLKEQNIQQALVFTSAVRTADNLVGKLRKHGIDAMALHSGKSQGARTDALQRFKTGKLRVLVATDLASRGIDIEKLPCVINYELPRSPKDYVHRIGRTGRATESGEAISLIMPDDLHHFGVIQKKMGKKVTIIDTSELNLHGF